MVGPTGSIHKRLKNEGGQFSTSMLPVGEEEEGKHV